MRHADRLILQSLQAAYERNGHAELDEHTYAAIARSLAPRQPRERRDGPIIHFASRSDAQERVHHGPSLCGSGATRETRAEQYVAGDWTHVDCKRCIAIKDRKNRKEDEDDARAHACKHQTYYTINPETKTHRCLDTCGFQFTANRKTIPWEPANR